MDRKSEQIIQKLQERIEQVDWDFSDLDTGVVLNIGDGIAFVRGLQDVQANELVRFENGTFGLALNLEENQVGVILLEAIVEFVRRYGLPNGNCSSPCW